MTASWNPVTLVGTSVSVLSVALLLAWVGRVSRVFGHRLVQRVSVARRVQFGNYSLVIIFSAVIG